MQLTFVTSNDSKFSTAQHICEPVGINLVRRDLPIIEIQSENGEDIARHKAAEAYAQIQEPIAVTDDSWFIPGLNGWPGPYMKYMNDWLTVEDFLNLTRPLSDRSVILRQIIVYQDQSEQKLFSADIKGTLLKEGCGTSRYSIFSIVKFDGSMSVVEQAADYLAITGQHNAWHDLAAWLKAK